MGKIIRKDFARKTCISLLISRVLSRYRTQDPADILFEYDQQAIVAEQRITRSTRNQAFGLSAMQSPLQSSFPPNDPTEGAKPAETLIFKLSEHRTLISQNEVVMPTSLSFTPSTFAMSAADRPQNELATAAVEKKIAELIPNSNYLYQHGR